jgi:hypothetical protein
METPNLRDCNRPWGLLLDTEGGGRSKGPHGGGTTKRSLMYQTVPDS